MVADVRCDPCLSYGDLDYEVDLEPFKDGILSGHIGLKARNVRASITGKMAMVESSKALFKQDTCVFATALPGAGIFAKGIVDIGLTLKLDLCIILCNNRKPTALATGSNVGIPNDSSVRLDLIDASKNYQSGWSPQLTSLEPNTTEDLDLYAKIAPELSPEFSANVLGQGAAAGFQFAGGALDVHAKAVQGEGVCGIEKVDRGVELDIDLKTDFGARADIAVLSASQTTSTIFAATSFDIYSGCKTINGAIKLERPTTMPTTSIAEFVPQGLGPGVMMTIRSKAEELGSKATSVAGFVGSGIATAAAAVLDAIVANSKMSLAAEAATESASSVADSAESHFSTLSASVSDGVESAPQIATRAADEVETEPSQATDNVGDIFGGNRWLEAPSWNISY